MNKFICTGNLVADPVQRGNEKKVTEFRVAVDRKLKVNGNKVTDFFRVKAFGKLGEFCFQYLTKGRKVLAIGELQADTYEDREGVTRLALDVVADEVEFLSKAEPAAAEAKPKANYTENDFTDIQSADIPF